jgi:hypothetical protein
MAERASELRRTREAEGRRIELEAVREQEPPHHEHERGHEVESEGHAERSHDDGLSHGL